MLLNEYKRYEEIILIDTENVGYVHPEELPKNILVIFFISNPELLSKFRFKADVGNYRIVNIAHAAADAVYMKKNSMDFTIVSYISYLGTKMSKKAKLVVLSADKDYEVALYYTNNLHKRNFVSRFSGNLNMYLRVDKKKQLLPLDEQIDAFHRYKRTLKPSEKKSLQRDRCVLSDNKTLFTEYDPLHDAYYLVHSGKYIEMRWTYDEIKTLYDNFVSKSIKKTSVVSHDEDMRINIFYAVE